MKDYGSVAGGKYSFADLEVMVTSKFVEWLYKEKDTTYEEFLAVSTAQQNNLVAQFQNSLEN